MAAAWRQVLVAVGSIALLVATVRYALDFVGVQSVMQASLLAFAFAPGGFIHNRHASTRSSLPRMQGEVLPYRPSRGQARASPKMAMASGTIYEYTVKDIDGKDVALKNFAEKVVLIVNVASK